MVIVAIILVIALLGLLYFLFPPIMFVGNSMYPTYKDGDIVLGTRLFNRKHPCPEDVYVVKVPWEEKRKYVKRLIYHSEKTGSIYVLGDNTDESYDSKAFGWISQQCLVAKVLYPKRLKSERSMNREQQ